VNSQNKRKPKDKRAPQNKRAAAAPQPAPVRLEARVTIAQAADLHRTLAARVADGGPIVLDGTAVQEIDTAILQLLASLWRTTRERGTACAWQGTSDVLRNTAARIGVAEALHFADRDSMPGRDQ
jgi:phospholipid transport system transporter-binding protein